MTDKILRIKNEESVSDVIINYLDGSGLRIYMNEKEFESALPKDWRPICYDSQYNKLNGCDPLIITNSCAICPFLASRHKTKVTQKSGGLDINLDINRHKNDRRAANELHAPHR